MSADEFVKLQLRLPKVLHERLQRIATEEERSLNGQIVYFLRNLTDQYEERKDEEEEVKAAA